MSEAIASPHVLAVELAESWVNGNRTHVIDELSALPACHAAATVGYILDCWYQAESSARLNDARLLVKRLADRSEV